MVLKQLADLVSLSRFFGLSGLFGETIHFVNGSEPMAATGIESRKAGLEVRATLWK